jgi:hypothetical protein
MKRFFACLLLLTGCAGPPKLPPPPSLTAPAESKVAPAAVQAEAMRFADRYAVAVAQAADEMRQQDASPAVRSAAQAWKYQQASSAWILAANQNPYLNAADLVVLATLSRMVQEDHWFPTHGAAAKPLLDIHRQLEREAWLLLEKTLKPEQQKELRSLIAEWRAANPNQRYIAQVSLRGFAEAAGKIPPPDKVRPGSLFSLFMVDPLAGLDPAARAIEQTRYTAERSLYYFQRMPNLLTWQAELLTYELATTTEAKQLLANAERITKTAEQLPALVDKQREAAIKQVFDSFAVENEKIRGSIVEVRQALAAGTDAAKAVDGVIKSVDQLMARFPPKPPKTNEPPFMILDYAKTAAEVAGAARELNGAIQSLDKSLPHFQRLGETIEVAGSRWVDHLFLVAGAWAALLIALVLGAALLFRRLAQRGDKCARF